MVPVPVDVEVHTLPHFKAPINGKVDLWGPECGGTFILYYSLVKIGHLLHKSRPVPFVFSSTVCIGWKLIQASQFCKLECWLSNWKISLKNWAETKYHISKSSPKTFWQEQFATFWRKWKQAFTGRWNTFLILKKSKFFCCI